MKSDNLAEIQLAGSKWLIGCGFPQRDQNREIKNKGYSHDVVENKDFKKVKSGYSHDVDENKQVNPSIPRYC